MQIEKPNSDYFRDLETKLHKKEVRNSPELVSDLLADEFMEFGSSGRVSNKVETIESLKNEQVDLQITVEDFKVQSIAPELVLVTYKTSKLNPGAETKTIALRSSLWKLIAGKWRMIFHQGTPIKS